MSQNINLFSPTFRKPREILTLALVVQCMSVALIALISYHVYLQKQVNGAALELAAAQKLFKTQLGFVEKLKPKREPPETEAQLDGEIRVLEGKLKAAVQSMDALKSGAFGSKQGFAEYLQAFSRQWVSGLWLTAFSIGGAGELEMRGRTLNPELLPDYIQRLNREQVLAGRKIARLEITRPAAEAAPAQGKGPDDETTVATRFLEFNMATEDAGTERKP